VAVRLRLPALVGYLLAEVLIGPHTPGFVADVALAAQLAHGAGAELLVVTATDSTEVRRMIEIARRLNPAIPIVVRAPGAEEAQVLREAGAASALYPREALARVLRQDVVQGLETAWRSRSGPDTVRPELVEGRERQGLPTGLRQARPERKRGLQTP
jgi:hypothetical protein